MEKKEKVFSFKIIRTKDKRSIELTVSMIKEDKGILSGQDLLLAMANLCAELDGDQLFDKELYVSDEFKKADDKFH